MLSFCRREAEVLVDVAAGGEDGGTYPAMAPGLTLFGSMGLQHLCTYLSQNGKLGNLGNAPRAKGAA